MVFLAGARGDPHAAEAIALSVFLTGPAALGQTTTGEMYDEREKVIAELARCCYDFFLFHDLPPSSPMKPKL
jgi:hypothetical protein